MTKADWLLVAGFIVGGFVLGGIASRVVQGVLAAPTRPRPVRDAARPLSSLVFWIVLTIGLLAALGVIQPSAVTQMQSDLIDFLPRIMAAAIIFIVGNVLASFVQAALAQILARASSTTQRQVQNGVRIVIVTFSGLMAVAQLGVNTDILNLAVGAIFFGGAAAFALLVGLGGRQAAGEVAATRSLRRLIHRGDMVEVGGRSGEVVGIHPTALELMTPQGDIVLVPSSHLLADAFIVRRGDRDPEDIDE